MDNKILLEQFIPSDKEVLFACIGTDRSTGDSLGPLVGTGLSESGYTVIGTLHQPLHALNLEDALENIKQLYPNHFVVAIDACLGSSDHVGKIIVKNEPILPGAAFKKQLPPIGDVAIKGFVNISGYMEYEVLQSTRLSLVWDLAKEIITMCEMVMQDGIRENKILLTRLQNEMNLEVN